MISWGSDFDDSRALQHATTTTQRARLPGVTMADDGKQSALTKLKASRAAAKTGAPAPAVASTK